MTDKRRHFVKIAPKRTKEVLRRLKILGNCANRSYYEYSDAEVDKIFAAIHQQIESVQRRFTERAKNIPDFTLEDLENES